MRNKKRDPILTKTRESRGRNDRAGEEKSQSTREEKNDPKRQDLNIKEGMTGRGRKGRKYMRREDKKKA